MAGDIAPSLLVDLTAGGQLDGRPVEVQTQLALAILWTCVRGPAPCSFSSHRSASASVPIRPCAARPPLSSRTRAPLCRSSPTCRNAPNRTRSRGNTTIKRYAFLVRSPRKPAQEPDPYRRRRPPKASRNRRADACLARQGSRARARARAGPGAVPSARLKRSACNAEAPTGPGAVGTQE